MKFTTTSDIEIYPPSRQGSGSFDNGKITEIKPIDFPNGTSQTKRIGPLFYWAWASAKGDGVIGFHPHQAFEIMSYVLEGEIGHSDSLGNKSRVKSGGAQVMQAGSGIYHQEEMYGEQTEFFQIWFEPHLQETIRKPPTYNEFHSADFPVVEENGAAVKTLLGPESLVILDTEVLMDDVTVSPGGVYQRNIPAGKSLAVVTIAGTGKWKNGENDREVSIEQKDYTVIKADKETVISAASTGNEALRLVMVEVPMKVDYPLYS